MVVNRVFAAALALATAASLTGGPAAEPTRQALDELDALIGDTQSSAFQLLAPLGEPRRR
jgi:hypothetical protein